MKFVIRNSTNRQYYFNIVGGNNEPMATSETYVSKSSAQHAIKVIKADAEDAQVVDLT